MNIENQFDGMFSISFKKYRSSSKADSAVIMIIFSFFSRSNFNIKYSCANKWITIVIYVLKQLKLNLKVNILKVEHPMNLKNVYENNAMSDIPSF